MTGTSAALSLPSGFIEEPLGGNWNQAVGLTFDASGNLFVWEKAGRVWRVRADGTREPIPLLDLHEEVGDWRDHGMLGFALHPNFLSNGYIYALYAVDYHHLRQFGTPGYDSGQDDYFVDTQVRLTRYEARASDGFQTVDLASRRVLFGEEMGSGCPLHHQSHGAGSLVFGNDGTLLVTCGDGGSYEGIDDGGDIGGSSNTALGDGIITAAEDVGAFRAQLVDSMAGKVLRLDAATGDGVASNPFYDASAPRSARSRVWALGMRNPFRATLRPGTGAHDPAEGNPGVLYVGDVGWTLFEELDVVSGPGQNFGWPLFEGLNQPGPYSVNSAANLGAPNPLFGTTPPGRPLCSQQYFMFRELLVQDTTNALSFPNGCDPAQQIPPPRFEHTRPVLDWQHGEPLARVPSYSPSGLASVRSLGIDAPVVGNAFEGNSVTGGVWYVGSDFPETFRNTYFVADYDRGWVKNLVFDDQNRLLEVRDFSPSGNGALVAMATNPVEGGLYYITYANVVRRIRHVGGGNRAPLASVSADVTFGPSPLQVQLDGSQSRDPELGALTYEWNFGDGSPPSTAQSPVHNFDFGSNAPHTYVVSLRVTDVVGASNTATLQIVVNNAPPAVSLVSPIDGDVFSVTGNAETALLAAPFDGEQSAPELSCRWQTILHHNAHAHPEPPLEGCTQTVVVSPVPCDDEDYNYEFVVTVDDGAGLSATESSVLYPDCSPGALEPQGVTASTAPTFRWRRVQGADQYEVVVHDSATQGLISAVYAAAEVSCTSGPRCSLLAPVTLALGDASFTVRAHNPVAGWRGWSQPAAFIVSDAQPPPPPPPPAGSNLALTGTPIAAVTSPIGGGSPNLAIIRDGIKPEVGSTSSATQYDTYHGSAPASVDWVGYTFGGNQNFASVVFQEGLHFFDGGWFDTLTVQVRQAGVWVGVQGLNINPTYPGNNGINYQSFTLSFTEITGDGVRIYGAPGGAADFISVGELEVYASGSAPPPPPPVNQAPTANAGVDQAVGSGQAVTLSGLGSTDPEGSALSYAWTQIGTPSVTLSSAVAAQPSFTAPTVSVTTALTFNLVVHDGSLASAADTVIVTVTPPPPPPPPPPPAGSNLASTGTPIAAVTAPLGGGSRDLGIIRDGIKPAVGSTNTTMQYDTYHGSAPATVDWIGYTFGSSHSFTSVMFQEGCNFFDGGWFDTLTVQVRQAGVWVGVQGLNINPTYPGNNGINYQSFTLSFTEIAGDGIRIYGAPGGAADFISVGELEVYASGSAPPPPPPVNQAPTANAGVDQAVGSGQAVTLSGLGSTDPEGSALSYAWTQIGTPSVTLSSAVAAQPSFTAPTVSVTTPLTFRLVVNDGSLASDADTVIVTVAPPPPPPPPVNQAPTANAGVDQAVGSGQAVTLNGLGSTDPEGSALSYAWTQIGTPTVTLSSAVAAQPSFTAPTVSVTTALTFRLVVNDGSLASAADTVIVTVAPPPPPVNQAPTANAGVDQAVISGQAVTLSGLGSRDPEGSALSYAWTQIGTPSVKLSSAVAAQPSFTAPTVNGTTALTFRLIVNDGSLASVADTVIVTVTRNHKNK